MNVTRIDCPHCSQSGTCKANNGSSCGSCLKSAKTKKEVTIVQCAVCVGTGKAEPKTDLLNARLPFFIVIVVLGVFYLYAGTNLSNDGKFDQIFPLIGSLTTMIVTFYFTRKTN